MRLPVTAISTLALAVAASACEPARGGDGDVQMWPDSLPDAEAFGAQRGWTPVRAILHVHSVLSHDACDGEPHDESGRLNEPCLERFRDALCLANVDAAFLTEHDRHLARAESLSQAVSLRPGDERIEPGGRFVASRLPCGTLLYPGAENALMPIAFDSLPRGTVEARRAFYDDDTPGASETFRRYGAFVLLSHTEDIPVSRIAQLGPDAVEVYNPHSNFAPKHRDSQELSRLGAIVELLPFLLRQTPAHPDLALAAIFHRNTTAIDRWDRLLAQRTVLGFGASDAHENTIPWQFADGERGDGYDRMIPWVTNVVSVPNNETATPEKLAVAIEDALRAGHFYVAIEAWGTPVGFDFRAEGVHGVAEMGSTVALASGLRLIAEAPGVFGASDDDAATKMRLLHIAASGAVTTVAESQASIEHTVTEPGAYRVEVTIEPEHLRPYLGLHAGALLRTFDWVYSNPIRVVEAPESVAERASRE